MPWFHVCDRFHSHIKAEEVSNAAVGLWTRAGSWCSANLTDGFLPAGKIFDFKARRRDADALVKAGLWDAVDGGYQFHDWHDCNPSKARVQEKRSADAARRRVARGRTAGKVEAGERLTEGPRLDHVAQLSQGVTPNVVSDPGSNSNSNSSSKKKRDHAHTREEQAKCQDPVAGADEELDPILTEDQSPPAFVADRPPLADPPGDVACNPPLRQRLATAFERMYIARLSSTPARTRWYHKEIDEIATWVSDNHTAYKLTDDALIERIFAGFFASSEAAAAGFRLSWVLKNPQQFCGLPPGVQPPQPKPVAACKPLQSAIGTGKIRDLSRHREELLAAAGGV